MSSPEPPPAVPVAANWSPLTNDLVVTFSRLLAARPLTLAVGWSGRAQNRSLNVDDVATTSGYDFATVATLGPVDIGPSFVAYAGGDADLRDDLGRLVPPFAPFPLSENP